MNRAVSLLGALGVGAGLMYFLDPAKGRRRRALLQDQALRLANETNRQLGKQTRDLQNRTKGLIAETERIFTREDLADERLEARIRTRLGRLTSHPHAIKTEVEAGRVRLGGHILAEESQNLLNRIGKMRGVKEVENALEIHTLSENLPALQPNNRTARKNGKAYSWQSPNFSPAARLLSTAAGLGCAVYAAKKRGFVGSMVGATGLELISYGLLNHPLERMGAGAGDGKIHVRKTITINAPVERVYEICMEPENFPKFMSHIRRVEKTGEGRYRWTVTALPGVPLSWETQITEIVPNKKIKYQSVGGARFSEINELRLEQVGDNATRLSVDNSFAPIGGIFGNAIAKFFRTDPKSELDDDLLRMKSVIETGKVPHDAYAEVQKRRGRKMKIKEIMTENPACCEPNANLQEAARLMAQQNCGAIPVIENEQNKKPIGIITDRDITVRATAQGKNPADSAVKDFMTTAVLTLTPDASLEECCELMEKNQVRRMLVVDENGALAGIVAQADVARKAPEYETAELVKDVSMPAQAAT